MDIFVYLTLCFTSLFTLMDPLGVMPVFLQMTDGMDTDVMRSGSDFQWNNIDGRCFGIYFQNSIAWRNRFGLHSFLLYSVRVHPAFKNLGRDGKQCDDETDGTYSNGDRRGMFYQRDTSGIN